MGGMKMAPPVTKKKKVDSRVRTLIESSVHAHQRSIFVLVGDHGKDQVVNLHYMLSKARMGRTAKAGDTMTAVKCWPSPSTARCVHSRPALM